MSRANLVNIVLIPSLELVTLQNDLFIPMYL